VAGIIIISSCEGHISLQWNSRLGPGNFISMPSILCIAKFIVFFVIAKSFEDFNSRYIVNICSLYGTVQSFSYPATGLGVPEESCVDDIGHSCITI
jgi:hypothetical protein